MTTTTKPTVNQILVHLHQAGRSVDVADLADTKTLDALAKAGLVDLFGNLAYLTPKGRAQIVSPATVLVVEPGNGTRYVIVTGTDPQGNPFVALPDFGVAATMSPYPAEWGYVAEKLHLGELDAKAVFAALNPERG